MNLESKPKMFVYQGHAKEQIQKHFVRHRDLQYVSCYHYIQEVK